jgi:hypothetical protein
MNFNLVVQYRWFTQEQDLFDAHQILRNGQIITPKRGGNPSPGLMPASKPIEFALVVNKFRRQQ